jgi:plastocyanin
MDLDGSIFFYLGGALVAAALVLSFIGIRGKGSFPPSGALFTGLTALFALLVVATGAYAVANAEEEQDKHDAEVAAEEAEAQEQEGAADAGAAPAGQQGEEAPPAPGGPAPPPPGGGAETLDVTSPDDGSLVFDPDAFEAKPGKITLAYDNPSPVPHSIALEDAEGNALEESDEVTSDSVEISAELAVGEYVFYCTVPGHRESGMEGTLTVE